MTCQKNNYPYSKLVTKQIQIEKENGNGLKREKKKRKEKNKNFFFKKIMGLVNGILAI